MVYKIFISTCLSFFIIGCASSSIENKSIPQTVESSLVPENDNNATVEEVRIQEVYWKLIGVMGKAVVENVNEREAYIILKLEDNRLQGFAGCNLLMGSYALEKGNKIAFFKVASTMMACPRLNDESAFLKVLNEADNYTIKEGVLMLHKGTMAPLASFEAVYMH